MTSEPSTSHNAMSWRELDQHGTGDDLWIVIDGKAYDVSEWARHHPGGQLVLMHQAGRDATQAFQASHPAWVRTMLPAFCTGRMEDRKKQRLQQEEQVFNEQEEHVFNELKREVTAAGLMKPRIAPYASLAAFLAALFCAAAYFAVQGKVVAAALTIALFWQQVAFIGHDVGHNALTHDRTLDGRIGLLVNAAVGIGFSWWKSTHNVHHLVVNTADSDPDIQFMPLLAISEDFFGRLWSKYHQDLLVFDDTAKLLISRQHLTFIPLLMVAKFGLYLQSVKQLMHGKAYVHRGYEIAAQAMYVAWYLAFVACFPGVWRKLLFVQLSHAMFFVLHLQICLSHFACPVSAGHAASSDDWMTQQVGGTMNWTCPAWLDWFHGGLQFQIEHHLFPRMPRHNLRAASHLVKPACLRLGIRYHSPSFFQAIMETFSVLRTAAIKARQQVTLEFGAAENASSAPGTVLSRAFI